MYYSLLQLKFNIIHSKALPDPDRPTIPIFSLGRTSNETLFNANGKFSLYLILYFLNVIHPSEGQSSWGRLSLTTVSPSDSTSCKQ